MAGPLSGSARIGPPTGAKSLGPGRHATLSSDDCDRQRDLLPLPVPEVLTVRACARSLSRPVRQRIARRQAVSSAVAESVRALNWCWHPQVSAASKPSASQLESLSYVEECIDLIGGAPSGSSPQAALEELLGSQPLYGNPCKVAAYHDGSVVSLPARAGVVPLSKFLPETDRVMLDRFEQSLFVSASVLEERRALHPN